VSKPLNTLTGQAGNLSILDAVRDGAGLTPTRTLDTNRLPHEITLVLDGRLNAPQIER
jgi:hypothetical protein